MAYWKKFSSTNNQYILLITYYKQWQTYNIVCKVCIFASRADSLCNNILRSWLTLSCNICDNDNEANTLCLKKNDNDVAHYNFNAH